MKELCLFLQCEKVFRKENASLEDFNSIVAAMTNVECNAIIFEGEAWIKKEQVMAIILKDIEMHNISDAPQ